MSADALAEEKAIAEDFVAYLNEAQSAFHCVTEVSPAQETRCRYGQAPLVYDLNKSHAHIHLMRCKHEKRAMLIMCAHQA
jgi:hypothetical protein